MVSSSNSLQGRIAIVTGSSRGIGHAITEALANNGVLVYAVARTPDSLTGFKQSSNIVPCYFDITESKSIKNLFLRIKKEQGRLDILVNNAGIMQDALIGMITDNQIERTFAVNVYAPIHFIQYASKLMLRQKSGSIINISSVMGLGGNASQLVYSASKGAVVAMTKAAAKELTPKGIRVNAIAPGVIETGLLRNVSEEKLDSFIPRIAAGHLGTPEDVANLVVFLASEGSAYISGQVIGIDGMMIN